MAAVSDVRLILRRAGPVSLATFAAQVLGLGLLPVLTRLYGPAQFGELALFQTWALLVTPLISLRLEMALVLSAWTYRAQALCLLMALIAVAYGIALTSVWAVAVAVGTPFALSAPMLILLAASAAVCFGIVSNLGIRFGNFRLLAAFQFAFMVLPPVVQIGFGLVQEPTGLVLGFLAGQILSLVLFMPLFMARRFQCPKGRRLWAFLRTGIAELRRFRVYPTYIVPRTLIGQLNNRMLLFMLDSLGGKTAAGYFGFCQRLGMFPSNIVSAGLRPMVFHYGSTQRPEDVARLVRRLFLAAGIGLAPFFGWGIIHAEWLLTTLFGAPWSGAAPYMQGFGVIGYAFLISNWMDRIFDLRDRQRWLFFLDAGFFVALLGTLSAAWLVWDISSLGLFYLFTGLSAVFLAFWTWFALVLVPLPRRQAAAMVAWSSGALAASILLQAAAAAIFGHTAIGVACGFLLGAILSAGALTGLQLGLGRGVASK